MPVPKKIAALRRQFPQLRGRVYFNHAANATMPTSVIQAATDGLRIEPVLLLDPVANARWRTIRVETRAMTAELINAAPDNVAFVASTSTALALISLAIPWKKGDNVVTAGVENPATVVPWQNQRHLGVSVRYLPANGDDLIDLDALESVVDRRTRLVALSLVEYSTGQRLDIGKVARWCKARNILVSVDAVQAVGAIPVDVQALGVNFLSFGVQKWMLGPRNIAAMYVDDVAGRLVRCPIVTESNVPDIGKEEEQPTRGVPQLMIRQGAMKFEALPYHNFAGVCGLHQALQNFRAVGAAIIHKRLRALTDELVDGLGKLGGRVVSPRGDKEWSGIVSYAPDGPPAEIVTALRERKVHVAMRKGRLRISPHYYNTSEDIRKFLAVLAAVSRKCRSQATKA